MEALLLERVRHRQLQPVLFQVSRMDKQRVSLLVRHHSVDLPGITFPSDPFGAQIPFLQGFFRRFLLEDGFDDLRRLFFQLPRNVDENTALAPRRLRAIRYGNLYLPRILNVHWAFSASNLDFLKN